MSTAFQAITVVGGVVPPTLLGRIQNGEVSDAASLKPSSYHLIGGETARDAASRSWGYLKSAWNSWRELDEKKGFTGAGTGDARQRWLLVLFRELGYGQIPASSGKPSAAGNVYPVSHLRDSVPLHLLGPRVELDKKNPGVEGAARAPQAMLQEFLNREETYLWGFLSNGYKLRLLRDSNALAGSAYLEFDLQTIFESELYTEFQLLWQVCHQSRLEKRGGPEASPADCWLETWRSEAVEAGARALGDLGLGVEKALQCLGTGFLKHPSNTWLVEALREGELSNRDFHKALLRLAYRLLFCFVVEDRQALLDPATDSASRARYIKYFSTQRLRKLSRVRDGGPHPDLWRTQKMVLSALGGDGLPQIGLPALGGLFDPDPRARRAGNQPHKDLLLGAELANQDLLRAIYSLSWIRGKSGRVQPVDYCHLGAEEFGSVYESLLELIPRVELNSHNFSLERLAGNERKVTGSYYTPPSLVSALLDTALDPLIDEAVTDAADATDAEQRLLALTVCDPASGSGGFLVAAARRIARRLAHVRSDEGEPTPSVVQHALHDVVERCIYGVDMNDLAAELAKVSLWLEAMEPGKPLGFLDARIKIGNSLVGVTPALLASGVPDDAFKEIEGDDKKYAADIRKRNRLENAINAKGSFSSIGQETLSFDGTVEDIGKLISRREALTEPVFSVGEARARMEAYALFDSSSEMSQRRLHADAWAAAFVWPLRAGEAEPPTSSIVRQLGESGEAAGFDDTVAKVQELAQEYRFFHWHLEFPEIFGDPQTGDIGTDGWPGGFSCLLGNPPWERVKLQEKEFFAARDEAVSKAANAAARRKLIAALAASDAGSDLYTEYLQGRRRSEATSHYLRFSGQYPLGGRGDVNTYVVFTELFTRLVAPLGRIGAIVKTGIATDDTTKYLFKSLTVGRRLVSFFDFENKRLEGSRYFEGAHASERFCLLTLTGRKGFSNTLRLAFRVSSPEAAMAESYFLKANDVSLMNPISGTLPVFKNQRDVDITRAIYNRFPIIKLSDWPTVSYERMLDVTNDSEVFEETNDLLAAGFKRNSVGQMVFEGQEKYPLYEGKMISHWDHRNADVVWSSLASQRQRQPSYISNAEKRKGDRLAVPGYWVDPKHVPNAGRSWQIGFSSVTAATNQRTFSVAAIPPAGVTNSLPLIRTSSSPQKRLCLLSALSSFAFDYVSRQKIGGVNLNYYIVDQLPIMPSAAFDGECIWDVGTTCATWIATRAYELVFSASDMQSLAEEMSDLGGPFIWDENRRISISVEMHAAFFHLYGLDRNDAAYVLDSFSGVRRNDCAKWGEYRTKRLILEVFDAMQTAIDTGTNYQTILDPPPGQGARHPAKEQA